MKVAFDVSGTLRGGHEDVEALFKWFKSKGCQMVIWSNSWSYAKDEAARMGMPEIAEMKSTKGDKDHDESQYVDIAIDDDRNQTWLAAKHFIFVHQIVHPSKFEETYGPLLTGGSNG